MENVRRKWFDYSFLAFGLLLQIVTYTITLHLTPYTVHLTSLSLISGLLGVCSVCLTAQGNIWTYFFGFAQVGTYMALVVSNRFMGQIALNVFYLITMIYGVFVWRRRLQDDARTVTPRRLSLRAIIPILIGMLLFSAFTGFELQAHTSHPQPYLDAFTSVPALVAQVLMILAYREHWFIWLAVDILNIILWLRAGDYCMAAQYVFWCANCLYGLRRWKTLTSNL